MKHVLLVLVALAVGGCRPPIAEPLAVYQAEQRGDLAFLAKVCDGSLIAASDDQTRACSTVAETAALGPAGPPDCATVGARFKSVLKPRPPFVAKMAAQLSTCKLYTALFQVIAAHRDGDEMLAGLERAGHPIEDAFDAYAKRNPGKDFLAGRRGQKVQNVFSWLGREPHRTHCDEVVAAITGASEHVVEGGLKYLVAARCSNAMPMLTERLAARKSHVREAACRGLGVVGDRSVAQRLQAIARSDPYSYAETRTPTRRSDPRLDAELDALNEQQDENDHAEAEREAAESERESEAHSRWASSDDDDDDDGGDEDQGDDEAEAEADEAADALDDRIAEAEARRDRANSAAPVRTGRILFPVRDACKQALAKLEARTKGPRVNDEAARPAKPTKPGRPTRARRAKVKRGPR